MNRVLRAAMLLGVLAMAAAPMTGCGGTECGPGTKEADGQCVPKGQLVTEDVCAQGTMLVDGACVLDESGCGENTQLDPDSGACVQVPGYCGEGTTWDAGAEQCVPNTDIACGSGTTADGDQCVPALDTVCGPKTADDGQGHCVIQADACADGEVLDPNSGDCVATDTYCSANTAFDADSGTCMPTADVCDAGTKFDSDSGLCLPDACQAGDVLLNSVCVSPAEELAANADLSETENNDPAMGGTAETLTVKPVGETTVFTGAIDAPSDLDGDSMVDQDRDAFTFDATAGQWFQIAAQSTGLPAPGFMVEGPNGYMRYSPLGLSDAPARKIVAPMDGTYTITVMPSLIMASSGDVGPVGNADWSYVGSLEQIDAPTATDVDLSAANITGSYDMLDDNLFSLTGLSAGDVVELTVDASGDDADGILQVWSDATTFVATQEISSGDTAEMVVPASGSLLVLIDWSSIRGPQLDFDISGALATDVENLGSIADDDSATSTPVALANDDTYTYTFTVGAGQVIELTHDNGDQEEVDFELLDAAGKSLLSDTYVDALSDTTPDYNYWYSANGGTYILKSTATTDLTDDAVTINTYTPQNLTPSPVGIGDSASASVSTPLDYGRSMFFLMTTSGRISVSGDVTTPAGEDVDAELWNAMSEELDRFTSSGSVTVDSTILETAGDYLLRVDADEDLPSYDISLSFAEAPMMEQEPNNTDATASPYDITKKLVGTVDDSDELDIFELTLPSDLAADEVFIVDMHTTDGGTDEYTCMLRDSSGNEVGNIDPDGDEDGCLTMSTGLTAGTYYFQVERTYGSGEEAYEISTRTETGVLEVEPNDTDTNATSFDLDNLTGGYGLFGNLSLDTDTDVFSFTLASDRPAGEVLTFSSERLGYNPTSTLDWSLLDSSMTEIDSGDIDVDLSATSLTAGTYYIEVTRTSSTSYYSGTYKLTATSVVPVCGNGTVETGETCDDGNTNSGDGCTSSCQLGTPTATGTASPGSTIDGTTPTQSATVTLSGCSAPIWGVSVDVDITHTWRGDLVVELTSPDGTVVRLADNTGGSADDIIGNYPADLTVDGPGSLSDYVGETGNGDWTLTVEDTATFADDGTFNSFTVNAYCQ